MHKRNDKGKGIKRSQLDAPRRWCTNKFNHEHHQQAQIKTDHCSERRLHRVRCHGFVRHHSTEVRCRRQRCAHSRRYGRHLVVYTTEVCRISLPRSAEKDQLEKGQMIKEETPRTNPGNKISNKKKGLPRREYPSRDASGSQKPGLAGILHLGSRF